MFKAKEKGFTLAELLVVILIIAILAALAFVFFADRVNLSEDSVAEANLRSALLAVQVEYIKEKESFLSGPLATGVSDQDKAEGFVMGAIEKSSNIDAVASTTPAQGKIGVEMNAGGTAGTLYAKNSTGYAQRLLP